MTEKSEKNRTKILEPDGLLIQILADRFPAAVLIKTNQTINQTSVLPVYCVW